MSPHTSSVLVTVVVLIIAGIVGLAVIEGVEENLGDREDLLEDRAEDVYGDDYITVQSSACLEYCSITSTTRDQQYRDALYTLKRDGGWVSEWKVNSGITGNVDDALRNRLYENGYVSVRSGGDPILNTEYRYRPLVPTKPPTDKSVERRVHNRLYVTAAPMDAGAISSDLPVDKDRVLNALQTLESEGEVDSGYVNTGLMFSEKKWVAAEDGELPDHPINRIGVIFSVLLIAIILALVVSIVARHLKDDE